MRQLAQAWLHTAGLVGARGDVAGAGAALLARYAEAHRRYHDIAHLADVLRRVDELAEAATDPEAVRLAGWFHDAFYDVTAADNEERSARLAATELTALRVEDRVAAEVARLVRLTASHNPTSGDANGAVLCDADLAILASDGAAYPAYVERVRTEWRHLDDATFARGRALVLRGLLGKATLFATADGRVAWEDAARRNVTAELATLSRLTGG